MAVHLRGSLKAAVTAVVVLTDAGHNRTASNKELDQDPHSHRYSKELPFTQELRRLRRLHNHHRHDFEEDSSELKTSLSVGLSILAVGVFFWPFFDSIGWTTAKDGGGTNPDRRPIQERLFNTKLHDTVALNYVQFLAESRNMFVTLTVLSGLFTVGHFGLGPITMGIFGHSLNTGLHLDDQGLFMMCMDTFVRGIVAWIFIEKLRRASHRPIARNKDKSRINRTLWLTDLPKTDVGTGVEWNFSKEEFSDVERDLKKALKESLNSRIIGQPLEHPMEVHVAPIVNEWYECSVRQRDLEQQKAAYAKMMCSYQTGCIGRRNLQRWRNQYDKVSAQLAECSKEFQDHQRARTGMSGSAFVTFESEASRNYFLKAKPRWHDFNSACYWSFGRKPFASVTLKCYRAPHPIDVAWLNLHVSPLQQWARGLFMTLMLFICMIILVSPAVVIPQLDEVLPLLQKYAKQIVEFLFPNQAHDDSHSPTTNVWCWWDALKEQAPGLYLVVINSLLLPDVIARLADKLRTHRKSQCEVIGMYLNYIFLILNSFVVPLLQFSSLTAFVALGTKSGVEASFYGVVTLVLSKLVQSPVFFCKYVLSCACVSNVNNLLQFLQLGQRAVAQYFARTVEDHVEAFCKTEFAWGYWYAWTLSIYTLGICLSSFMPALLPASALFFLVQYFVDRHNLSRGVYMATTESENAIICHVLHYMRAIVALWWTSMSIVIYVWAHWGEATAGQWRADISKYHLDMVILFMFVSGCTMLLWSWFDLYSILHDSNFEEIDVSKRGKFREGVWNLIEKIRKGFWRSVGYTSYGYYKATASGRYAGEPGGASDIESELEQSGRRGSMIFERLGVYAARRNTNNNNNAENQDDSRQPNRRDAAMRWDASAVVHMPHFLLV